MRRLLKFGRTLLWLLFALSLYGAVLWQVLPRGGRPHAAHLGVRRDANLPWEFREVGVDNHLFFDLDISWGSPRRWTLLPDDKLVAVRVNGEVVPYRQLDIQNHKMFDVDLGPWLHDGRNEVEFVVNNTGGPGALWTWARLDWRLVLIGVSLLPWCFLLARWFGLQRNQLIVCLLGLALLLFYWNRTYWFERENDFQSHIDYIEYIRTRHLLPPPHGGWSFFHPPLYYLLGTLATIAARAAGLFSWEHLQALSLLLWCVYLFASVGTLRLVISQRHRLLVTFVFVFWPLGVLHSVRVGNDLALYACAGICTWHFIRYWQSSRRLDWYLAVFWATVGMLCKTNASVLVASLFVAYVWRVWHERSWRHGKVWLDGILAGLLMSLGVCLAFGRTLYFAVVKGKHFDSLLVSNINRLPDYLVVPNTFSCYVPINLATYLTEPWMDVGKDSSGRQNFWNALLRESLSGEYVFYGKWQERISYVWGVLLLLLVVQLLWRARWLRRPRFRYREAPWLLLAGAWVASLMVLRYTSPYGCSMNFRYILPVLLPFVVACARRSKLARGVMLAIVCGTFPFLLAL